MSQKKSAQHSSRKDKKQLRPFRFGLPLDQLPCTYLPDFGNVTTFLVETGEVIWSHMDVEGLFRKSADLSRQDELKLQAEQGMGLGDLDVHEVTCLVKTFFRLLPEPLLPCLFHDPFLSSMDLPDPQRTQAVQGLCFTLPAPHLSCLRYFMNLLAHVVDHVEKNRMNARNLAVVLTPCLIRLKARTKLMSPEELRVLPKQTSLIEHLICHADGIGCMTTQLYHHSVKMAEERLQKKLNPKRRRKSKVLKNLEQHLGAARAALGILASLHFRPNTSTTVSDTVLVDGPYGQAGSLLQNTGVNSESELLCHSHVSGEAGNTYKAPLIEFPSKTHRRKHRHRSKQKRQNVSGHCNNELVEKCQSREMLEPLIRSWSGAIPVIYNHGEAGSDPETSEDSSWSDEDSCLSDSDDEENTMADSLNDDLLLATHKSNSRDKVNCLTSESCDIRLEGDKMFSCDLENTNHPQQIPKGEWKLTSKEPVHSQEVVNSDRHRKPFEFILNSDHGLVNDGKTHCLSEEHHLNMREESDKWRTFTGMSTSPEGKFLQSKNDNMLPKIVSQLILPFIEQSKETLNQIDYGTVQNTEVFQFSDDIRDKEFQQENKYSNDEKESESETSYDSYQKDKQLHSSCNTNNTDDISEGNDASYPHAENIGNSEIKPVQEDVLVPSYEQSGEDGSDGEKLNQHSESINIQQLSSPSAPLSIPLQSDPRVISANEKTSLNVPAQPINKLKSHLVELAQRYVVIKEEEADNGDEPICAENQALTFERTKSEAEDGTCLSESNQDQSVIESKGAMSLHLEAKQCEPSLHRASSDHLTTSPSQTERILSSLETQFEPNEQQTLLSSMGNVSLHLADYLKHERYRDLKLKELISKLHRPSVHYSVSRTDVSVPDQQRIFSKNTENLHLLLTHNLGNEHTSEYLDQCLPHRVRTSQNSAHIQSHNSNLPVGCDCCRMNSLGQENISHRLSLADQFQKSNQGYISYHHPCDLCEDVHVYKGSAPAERQPQCFDRCLPGMPRQSFMLPNHHLFHRMSYGFESLQNPANSHHYGTNFVSECAFAEERNRYRAEQYYRHLLNTVPVEIQNAPRFETYFSHRQVYPTLHSVMQESHEKIFTQEKHIRNENMKYKHDCDSIWTLNKSGGTCENINEKHQFNMDMNLQKLPSKIMHSQMWINKHSKNEWEFQTQNQWRQENFFQRNNTHPNMYSKQWNQQNCSFKQQELETNRNELNYDSFRVLEEINHLSESYQYLGPETERTDKDNCNQTDSSVEISNACGRPEVCNDSGTQAEASMIYNCMQTRGYPGHEAVVEYIKVLSENTDLWKENPVCNKADTEKQREKCSENIDALSSCTGLPMISLATPGFPQTMNDLDPGSPNISNQHTCDTPAFNLSPHLYVQSQVECAPAWSHLNVNTPIPSPAQQYHVHPQPKQNELQFPPQYVPLRSDASCTTKITATEPEKVSTSEKPKLNQREDCEQLLGEFNVCDTEDQTCAKNTEECYHESCPVKNEDHNGTSENGKARNISEAVYKEADFLVQDSPPQTISPCHLGDGQKGGSPDSTVVVKPNSPRKHRRMSPGTINNMACNTSTTPAMQAAEEKEIPESLIEQLELLSIQEKTEQDGCANNTHYPEEDNMNEEHAMNIPEVLYDNELLTNCTLKS